MRAIFFAFCLVVSITGFSQAGHTEIRLDPENKDTATERIRIAETGDHVVSHIRHGSITIYPAQGRATGAAVIIAPGGGHIELWIDHEGYRVAEWFSAHGVTAFVLKYRLGKETGSGFSVERESLADMQRAIRLVRSRATEWKIDAARIGVMGFSAGGELAALAANRFADGALTATAFGPNASDPIDRLSARPDFQVLIYPGNCDSYPVVKDAPPAFMLCGAKDGPGVSEGIARLYGRYHQAGVSTELHVFAPAVHGFGIRTTNKGSVANWPDRVYDWMGDAGWLKP